MEDVIDPAALETAVPMTDTVMAAPPLAFNDHTWMQMGYMIYDHCNPRSMACQEQGIPIPSATVLIKVGGKYTLRPEYTGPR